MIIAKYKFDKTIFENCMPIFNEDFADYTITDNEENNIITRTIESDILPTKMTFGDNYSKLPSAQSLLEILELNTSAVENFEAMFGGCSNLTKINCLIDIYGETRGSLFRMFYNCSKLETLDLSNWDLSETEIYKLEELFSGCKSLKTIILNNLRAVAPNSHSFTIEMDYMFADCESLESIDTTKITCSNHYYYMRGIFFNCKSLKTLDLSGWDFRGIDYIYDLFYGCESLESIDMSNLIFDSLCSLSNMFNGCKSLKSVNFSNCVHIPSARSYGFSEMDYMFNDCESLESIDLSFFNFEWLRTMEYAFNNCKALKTIKFPDQLNLHLVAYYNNAFENCSSLEELNFNKIIKYDYEKYNWPIPDDKPPSCENIIAGCTSLKKVSLKQCQDIGLINKIISSLNVRPVDDPGILNLMHSPLTDVDINSAKQKNWKIYLRGQSRPIYTNTKICSKNSNITKN